MEAYHRMFREPYQYRAYTCVVDNDNVGYFRMNEIFDKDASLKELKIL